MLPRAREVVSKQPRQVAEVAFIVRLLRCLTVLLPQLVLSVAQYYPAVSHAPCNNPNWLKYYPHPP